MRNRAFSVGIHLKPVFSLILPGSIQLMSDSVLPSPVLRGENFRRTVTTLGEEVPLGTSTQVPGACLSPEYSSRTLPARREHVDDVSSSVVYRGVPGVYSTAG